MDNSDSDQSNSSQSYDHSSDSPKAPSHLGGHRARLRQRFMKVPSRSLPDYEILEMLLHQVITRKDTKKLAKDLLKRFGLLQAVIFADVSDLKSVEGIGDCTVYYIKFLADLLSRLCVPIADSNFHVLSSWLSVLNYCQLTMGFKKKEYFRVWYG